MVATLSHSSKPVELLRDELCAAFPILIINNEQETCGSSHVLLLKGKQILCSYTHRLTLVISSVGKNNLLASNAMTYCVFVHVQF